jgi:AcrR family transcriptional regulator
MAPGSTQEQDAGTRVARRRLPASERRLTILDAALRTFSERGYEGAPMDEIAAAAGISKAVVYDHVASKRELYLELLDAIRADLESVIEAALAPLGAPTEHARGVAREHRVRVALTAFFHYVESHPEATRLLFRELQGADVSEIGEVLQQRVTAALAATLGTDPRLFRGVADKARALEMFAELLKSALMGLAIWWSRRPETPRDELVERSVALVWPAIERARASGR